MASGDGMEPVLDVEHCPGYIYEGLPTPTSIRLISELRQELINGAPLVDTTYGTEFPVLSFALRTADVAESPSYDCLSYTWGRPTRVFTSRAIDESSREYYARKAAVLCNGKLLWIGRNLYLFLQRLLQLDNAPQEFKDERFFLKICERDRSDSLWIDSICINQEDAAERGNQVQIMDRIYRNASIVIAWLGEGDQFSRTAVYELIALAGLKQDVADRARGLNLISSDLRALGLESVTRSAIYAFLSRSWVSNGSP